MFKILNLYNYGILCMCVYICIQIFLKLNCEIKKIYIYI